LALLPVQVTAQARHLAALTSQTDVADGAGQDEVTAIRRELTRVGEQRGGALAQRLAALPALMLVDPGRVAAVVEAAPQAGAAAWGRELGVAAVLEVTLSGYGAIPRRWQWWLIGTGVAEAVVQGVLVAQVIHNPWVPWAVGLEELGSELLTWGGGAWLFNARYAPVVLEARLVASRDGRVLWDDLVMVGVDRKALKRLEPAERERREVVLAVTASRAEQKLARGLKKALRRHGMISPPDAPF